MSCKGHCEQVGRCALRARRPLQDIHTRSHLYERRCELLARHKPRGRGIIDRHRARNRSAGVCFIEAHQSTCQRQIYAPSHAMAAVAEVTEQYAAVEEDFAVEARVLLDAMRFTARLL